MARPSDNFWQKDASPYLGDDTGHVGVPNLQYRENLVKSYAEELVAGVSGGGSAPGVIDATVYGVSGNGSNQTAALTAALNAAAGQKVVLLPPGDIVLDYLGARTDAIKLQGVQHATTLWVNQRASNAMVPGTTNGNGMLHVTGSKATGKLLTANATAGDLTVTVGAAAAATYAEGDLVNLRSNQLWPRTSKGAKVGELARVRSVDTTAGTVTFRGHLDFSYATADSAILEKITPVEGVLLRDLHVRGDGIAFSSTYEQMPIWLTHCRRFLIENVTMERIDGRAITLRSCIDGDIVSPRFYTLSNTGEDPDPNLKRHGYGVDLTEACRDIRIDRPYMRGGRHCVTTNAWGASGTTPSEGVPAHCVVSNGEGTEMTSTCFDVHIEGYAIIFDSCEAHDTQYFGFQMRADRCRLISPTVHKCEGAGIVIFDTCSDVVIDNPTIREVYPFTEFQSGSSGQFTSPGQGIRGLANNLIIRNPVIENVYDCGIRIDAGSIGWRIEGTARFRNVGIAGPSGIGSCIRIYGANQAYGHRFDTLDGDACDALVALAAGATSYGNEVQDLVIGTTVGPSGGSPSAGIMVPTKPRDSRVSFSIEDDFWSIDTTRIGDLAWLKGGGASSTAANIASVAGHPGIVQLSTGATTSTLAYLALTGNPALGQFMATDMWDLTWVFRCNPDSSTQIRVGAMVDPSGTITSGMYLEKLLADTNWFVVLRNASTETRIDTGVAAAGNAWHTFRARRVSSSAMAYSLDGVADTTSTVSTRPAVAVSPAATIFNGAAAAKTLDIDYFRSGFAGLAR